MRRTILLIFVLGSLKVSAQNGELKTPVQFIQRIIERSFEVPKDTTSIFVFKITKTADTLLVETIFRSTKIDFVPKKLYMEGLIEQIPNGFKCVAPVYCYRLFEQQQYPKQPDKSILDSAAAVIEKHGRLQTIIKPIVLIAYPPSIRATSLLELLKALFYT